MSRTRSVVESELIAVKCSCYRFSEVL